MAYAIMSKPTAAPKAERAGEAMSTSSLGGLAAKVGQQENQVNRGLGTSNMSAGASSSATPADNYCCGGCDAGTGHDPTEEHKNTTTGDNYQSPTANLQQENLEQVTAQTTDVYAGEHHPLSESQKETAEYQTEKGEEAVQSSASTTNLQDKVQGFNVSDSYSSVKASTGSVGQEADNYCCGGCDAGTGHDPTEEHKNTGAGADNYQSNTVNESQNQNLEQVTTQTADSHTKEYNSLNESHSNSKASTAPAELDADNYCCGGCDAGTGHDPTEEHKNTKTGDNYQSPTANLQQENLEQVTTQTTDAHTEEHSSLSESQTVSTQQYATVEVTSNSAQVTHEATTVGNTTVNLEIVTQNESKQYQSNKAQAVSVQQENLDQTIQQYANESVADTPQKVKEVQRSQQYDTNAAVAPEFETSISATTVDQVAQMYTSSHSVEVTLNTAEITNEATTVNNTTTNLEQVTQTENKQYQSKKSQTTAESIEASTTSESVYAKSEEQASSEITPNTSLVGIDEVVNVLQESYKATAEEGNQSEYKGAEAGESSEAKYNAAKKSTETPNHLQDEVDISVIAQTANDISNAVVETAKEYQTHTQGVKDTTYKTTTSNVEKGIEAVTEELSLEYNPLIVRAEQALPEYEASLSKSIAGVYVKGSGEEEEHKTKSDDDEDDESDEENKNKQSAKKLDRNKKSKKIDKKESEKKKEKKVKKTKKQKKGKKSDKQLVRKVLTKKEASNKKAREKVRGTKKKEQSKKNHKKVSKRKNKTK